jgi:NhaP-type Na+/H+ and K+/H+ antiporter
MENRHMICVVCVQVFSAGCRRVHARAMRQLHSPAVRLSNLGKVLAVHLTNMTATLHMATKPMC